MGLILFLILSVSCVYGEMGIPDYFEQQTQAPEYLLVKIEMVDVLPDVSPEIQKISLDARVMKPYRSQMKLKQGDLIKIIFNRYESGLSSESLEHQQYPMLERGKIYPVYLYYDFSQRCYIPAAGVYSFETIYKKSKITNEGDPSSNFRMNRE